MALGLENLRIKTNFAIENNSLEYYYDEFR